jgi:hypothetical protein
MSEYPQQTFEEVITLEKEIVEKLGKEALTVEERAIFSNIWKSATKIDKIEMASRICHLRESTKSVAEDFLIVIETIRKYDQMYS